MERFVKREAIADVDGARLDFHIPDAQAELKWEAEEGEEDGGQGLVPSKVIKRKAFTWTSGCYLKVRILKPKFYSTYLNLDARGQLRKINDNFSIYPPLIKAYGHDPKS